MALRLDYQGHRPHQGTGGAAGLDLYAAEDSRIADGTIELVGTGTRLAIPSGFFGMLAIRSSLGARGVALANGVGIIDSDYRGEVKVAVHNLSGEDILLSRGERVAQIIIVPFAQVSLHEVIAFGVTERGDGGFGSTGRT